MATVATAPAVPRAAPGRARRLARSDLARSLLFLLLPAAYLVVVLLLPIFDFFLRAVRDTQGQWTLDHVLAVFTNPSHRRILLNTVVIASVVTLSTMALGYCMSYFMAEKWPRAGAFALVLVIVTLWSSALARTYAFMAILGYNGLLRRTLQALGWADPPVLLYTPAGAVVGMVSIMLPYAVLVLYAVMRRVDRDLLRASASLGGSPIRTFWRVYLPATMPGVAAAGMMVFVLTLGFYVTPAILGGPQAIMIAQQIVYSAQMLLNFEAAAALSLILVVLTLAVLALMFRVTGIDRFMRLRG